MKKQSNFPQVRYITSYEVAEKIKEKDNIYSRPEAIRLGLIEKEDDPIWNERSKAEQKHFNTEDIIFCTVDWFNDYGHETGHGPIMFYFKDSLCEDLNITLTLTDSFDYNGPVINKEEIPEVFKSVQKFKGLKENIDKKDIKLLKDEKRGEEFYDKCGLIINSNLEKKNNNGFYDHYAELQVHTKAISTSYIEKEKRTENYIKENMNKLVPESLDELINESIYFERGLEPKNALKIGRRAKIEEWLEDYNRFSIDNYQINDDFTIDLIGSGNFIEDNLSEGFPEYIQFNLCTGFFDLDNSRIPSLRGCPRIVNGYFSCQGNNISSLEGISKEIKENCYILNNIKEFSEKEIREYSVVSGTVNYFDPVVPSGTIEADDSERL